jgi:restriction system protein
VIPPRVPVALGVVLIAGLAAYWHPWTAGATAAGGAVALAGGRWAYQVRTIDPELRFCRSIARLMRASGCRQVRVFHGLGDMGADIVAYAADGRRLAVRCRHALAGPAGPDIERFAATARRLHRADLVLYVTGEVPGVPCRTTARRRRVTLIDRNALEVWTALKTAVPGTIG